MALVPGEIRTLTSQALEGARRWRTQLETWIAANRPVPAGVDLTWPTIATTVAVGHAADGGTALCGIDEQRYEVYRTYFRPNSPLTCPDCRRLATGA
ncbi:hypothetical protein [Promicromonospora sukumoe]